jgi:plasmid stabilization system protein ParE
MQVIWSKNADVTFEIIADYIEAKFGKKVAFKFVLKVDAIILSIQNQPLQFKASSKFLNVRKATINRQCSLFYEINKTDIHLLYFWNNRQNPID